MATQQENLEQAITAIQKKWGTQAIQKGSNYKPLESIPTGFAKLDTLLGGGIPRGGITELIGLPTSGMTTIALNIMTAVQRMDEGAVYIDAAAAFDPAYAQHCGVNPHELILIRDEFETLVEILYDSVTTGIPGVVIFNSLPKRSVKEQYALSEAAKRLVSVVSRSRCAVIILTFPSSGRSLLSQCTTLRMRTAFERWLEVNSSISGYQSVATVLQDKIGRQGQQVPIQIMFDDKSTVEET